MSREWSLQVHDMIGFCRKLMEYSGDLKRAEFERHGMVYDAIVRNLELLGEAARHVPEDVRARTTEIEWGGPGP